MRRPPQVARGPPQGAPELILGQHAPDRLADDFLRLFLLQAARADFPQSAGMPGMPAIDFGVPLPSGQLHPGRIHDDHVVTEVQEGREIFPVLSPQQGGHLGRQPA